MATSWTTTFEQQLASDYSARFLERIKRRYRVVLYDRRGVGASGRELSDVTLRAQIDDLQCVVDAVGFDECDVLGDNDGCYVAAAFAARHPKQVRRMALWAPLVTGKDARPQAMREFAQLMRDDWVAARAQWAAYRAPNGSDDERRQIGDGFGAMISPEVAAEYLEWEAGEDVGALLAGISAPTLVVNTRRGGARSMGVAELIRGARFEPLDSDPATGRPDPAQVADVILRFFDG
ncbi:MAG: alpha/beta hydrolase [Chloroflexota bacterium]|nr:alpha/beta hydrolase [Chloroflexota bacterium]